jgi:hypothetical protein
VVLLALVVHVIRRNTVDIVLFLVIAVLIVVEPRLRLASRPRPAWLDRRAAAVTSAALLGAVVTASPRNSAVVEAALALVGVVALALVLRAGPGAPAGVAAPGWWVWAVVLLLGCLLELADFLSQPDAQTDNLDHPTLSGVVEPLLSSPWARGGAAMAWLLVGWWLVRLATQRDPAGRAR